MCYSDIRQLYNGTRAQLVFSHHAVGAAHGLFLALALINTKGASKAGHLYLAMLTLAFAIDLGHEFLYQSHYLLNVLELAFIDPVINLLYGPAFYLYTRVLTDQSAFQFSAKQWFHFSPVAAGVVICLLVPDLSSEQFTRMYYGDGIVATGDEGVVRSAIGSIAMASGISIGIYLALSICRLIRHARAIRQQFSTIERITLNWLRNLLIALSVLYLILILDGFLAQLFGFGERVNHLLYLMIVAVIYTMGYLGLRQPAIFTNQTIPGGEPAIESTQLFETNEPSSTETKPRVKYQTSALDAEMSAALHEELLQHMAVEKSFLNNKLPLSQLAEQLGISANYLSQVINEQFEKNFFDFINGLRVEEAKRLLSDPKRADISVLTIALDSGFNSKSAFYTAFNKHVGVTPSQFRKSVH